MIKFSMKLVLSYLEKNNRFTEHDLMILFKKKSKHHQTLIDASIWQSSEKNPIQGDTKRDLEVFTNFFLKISILYT